MNRRHEQRAATILRAVQETISRGLSDPRVRGLITVTGIRLTDDDRMAIVSVSVLPEERQELTLHGLQAAAAHIRREVAERIRIREMPSLEFRVDESVKKQAELLAAINKAAAEHRDEPVDKGGEPAKDDSGSAEERE
jgi:ribosome-binding factor A